MLHLGSKLKRPFLCTTFTLLLHFLLLAFQEQSTLVQCLSASPSALSSPTTTTIQKRFQIYIEDTDAYGVLYNANYLQYYERALLHNHNINNDTQSSSVITGIRKQRFKSSPKLGQEVYVQAKLLENIDGQSGGQQWQCCMCSIDEENPIVFNEATVIINHIVPGTSFTHISGDDLYRPVVENALNVETAFIVYRDELDVVSVGNKNECYLSIKNIMNLYERSRTTSLGGPDVLRKMQEEEDTMWVVTSVDCDYFKSVTMSLNPGSEVVVHNNLHFRRKGIVDYRQILFNTHGEKLAQALITIYAIGATTMRPKAAPQKLLDLFNSKWKSKEGS